MIWIWDLIFVSIITCMVFGGAYAMAVRPTYAARAAQADDPATDIGCLWLVFLFFLFLLPVWGGGLWIDPIGPAVSGSYVVNFLIVAAAAALFFGVVWALIPGTVFAWSASTEDRDGGWGVLFWLFLLICLAGVVLGYLYSSEPSGPDAVKQDPRVERRSPIAPLAISSETGLAPTRA